MSTTSDTDHINYRERYAYTLGVQAYVYGFPWVYLPSLRYMWVTQPVNPRMTPYAPVNQFWHGRVLADASWREGGCPNNDTLYSIAWLDVGDDPVILSVPDMGERYFSFQLGCMDSDNLDYVGARVTGREGGDFAVVGPDWSGELPDGVTAVERSRTPWLLMIGRTLVDGPDDLDAVGEIQDQYRLTPLHAWGDLWAPWDPATDPLADWKTMNRAMTENPPGTRHEPLLRLFATIGVGPGHDVETMDEATKRGLARAAIDGRELLQEATESGELGRQVNGWNFPARQMGRAGLADDFLLRSANQCLGGIISNDPEECVYIDTMIDANGDPIDGAHRYVLRFEPGQLPDVDAFWSLTAYGTDFNLIDNPIDRYSIGDRTPGVEYDDDGGLTIHLQAESPGADEESNWLPIADNGPLILRSYLPGESILDATWNVPAVTRVD